MKLVVKLLLCYSLIVLATACNISQKPSVLIAGSKNQWPMSGGPDGSWKVQTKLPIPTKWSVRTGENIKWKKTLPEGGQSGIAVWGDKLFLTINPPNEDPKHALIIKKYKGIKYTYDTLFKNEVEKLIQKNDVGFNAVKKALKIPKEEWYILSKKLLF